MEEIKKIMDVCLLLILNTVFNLQGSTSQTLPLIISQKSNTYQSVLIFQKNEKSHKNINNSLSFVLPEEIEKTIIKFKLLLQWKDEITALKNVSPVRIGNKELWAIDLWRISSKDRDCALSYHNKSFFEHKDCDDLKRIIPQEIKQDLVIHRLPLNDELYQDWAGIPGGRAQFRFLVSPTLGLITTGVGGLMICAFGHPYLNYGQSFAIAGGIGSVITIVGSAIAYARHRCFLAEHPVAIILNDV